MPRIRNIDLIFKEVSKTTANVHKNSPSPKFKLGQKVKLINYPTLQKDINIEIGSIIGFRNNGDGTTQGILYYYGSDFIGISLVKGVVIVELENIVAA